MRIATWNVNSVGARLPRLLDWLSTREPDVVALQETKCADAGFPFEQVADLGYEAAHVGDGRWNGVAVLSRVGLEVTDTRLADFEESRFVRALCGGLSVTSAYVPNGRSLDDAQYPYKLDWLAAFRDSLPAGGPQAGPPMALMGDFNIALTDRDVFDPQAFVGSTHVSAPERAALQSMLDWGLTDVPARPGKNDVPYTYWDYRAGMFHKDLGMRIDYVLVTPQVTVRDAYVDREARKGKLPSDHAPVIVDLDLPA